MASASRVLVADDQADVLEALRWLLTGEGYEAQFVTSAEAVMETLDRAAFDLLLMDLNYSRDTTSGREGLALIPRVRERDPHLPIVVMTGWGSIDTAVEAMRLGAKSFVQKPWDDAALREIVEREITDGLAARRQDRRQQRERDDARLIQRALLPASLPEFDRIRIATSWRPADGVGGDCFDVVAAGDRVGIVMADVAGKGMPAALLMSNLQAAVRAFASDAADPASICSSVNRLLCRHMVSGRFVTCCFAWLDPARHSFAYANAGHNPPLLIHANGRVERLAEAGVVMGIFPDATYSTATGPLVPGDRLLFFTDGITEAHDAAGDEFGEERLAAAALAARACSAEGLKRHLVAAIDAFTGGTFDDDATLMTIEIREG
ncbi:MAG TPA: SpoIIE family protein phosphatase [Vicinamibacterales bacterium]|nr:SpoIIE family protein phosphatase [Vicinamibacterales bacterium]